MTSRNATSQMPTVQVQLRGAVPTDAAEYARSKIGAIAEHTRERILHARAKLTEAADPAVARPSMAQANIDLNGRAVRAHVAAETMHEAIDLLDERLRRRMRRMAQHWEARRGGVSSTAEHEWRHGDEPTHRPDYYPRPVEQRQIVRHKSFALAVETADEAAFEMDAMDYDFHLFTDVDSGLDSVIYRAGPTGYRVAFAGPPPERIEPTTVALTISEQLTPRLDIDGAVNRLELAGLPFVFFVNSASGRGCLLYHRYDGHYGLITPAG